MVPILYLSTMLNIKSAEAHRIARELAHLRGSSLTDAVTTALQASLRAARDPTEDVEALLAEVKEVQALVAALPDRDGRSADAILGYDEWGIST